jgi:hypothetical protein
MGDPGNEFAIAMLADEYRDPFISMLYQQWQHVAMPERENEWRSPCSKDTPPFIVDKPNAPGTMQYPNERGSKRKDEPLPMTEHGRRRLAHGTTPAIMAAVRAAAPGVPSLSRTSCNPAIRLVR